jgi:4-diphosphocytidyl-2-C-methyl-D-erythritol kinase
MTALRLRAPAKINWTLEVLGERPDGYHEVRTILQTLGLADTVTITPDNEVSLSLSGDPGLLLSEPLQTNLAYRAAALLPRTAGADRPRGAHIELEKRIPAAAGLGGGSSNAAAVLRGLRALWQLDLTDDALATLAGELGSDVPFFLRGGCVLAEGRGERLASLPDAPPQRLLVAWPARPAPADKTARMYAAMGKEHFTDGARTSRLAEHLRAGKPIAAQGIYNAFENVLPLVDPAFARTLEELPVAQGPHLCGSGPAIFYLLEPEQPAGPLRTRLEELGLRAAETRTLAAAEALAIEEV